MAKNSKQPAFKSVVRVSPTQQVREQLLEAIERGDYGPGDALPSERALCDMFGVSRVSVREAIAGLEAMEVVTVQHGRGCFVAEGVGDRFAGPFGAWLINHREEMIDLLKVRGALDELAAYEAATRGNKGAIEELQEAHEAFARAVGSEDPEVARIIELDVEFHEAVARASGSDLLHNLVRELAGHIADSRRLTFGSGDQPPRSLEQHAAIVAAITSHEPDAAKVAAGAHVDSVRRRVEEQ